MFLFLLFLRRVLVFMGAVLLGMVVVMHLDFTGMLMGVGMIVQVPVGMGVGMLVGVNTRFMLMLMVMRMGMFVGMQVLVFRRIFHDQVSLDEDFPFKIRKITLLSRIDNSPPASQAGRRENS